MLLHLGRHCAAPQACQPREQTREQADQHTTHAPHAHTAAATVCNRRIVRARSSIHAISMQAQALLPRHSCIGHERLTWNWLVKTWLPHRLLAAQTPHDRLQVQALDPLQWTAHLFCIAAPECPDSACVICQHATKCGTKVLVQLYHLLMNSTEPALQDEIMA